MHISRRTFELGVLAWGALFGAVALAAEPTATQVLDRVNGVAPKAILEMAFEDPAQATPFDTPPLITTTKGFSACQLTATKGLFCLDQNAGNPGRWVRKWDPVTPSGEYKVSATSPYYFSCEDSVLALATSAGIESCTGITADDTGGVVIAGKRKGGYNLIKVVPKADLTALSITCNTGSEPWRQLNSNSSLCRKILLPRDRPLLVDVSYTKMTLPGGLSCTGVVGLETRTALMFFKDPDAVDDSAGCPLEPVLLADGSAWGLIKNPKEVLQGATTVNFPDSGEFFALVVSSVGRVLAKRTDVAGTAPFQVPLSHASGGTPVTSMAALRGTRLAGNGIGPNAACSALAQKYGIRTSTKSGSLYVTDQNSCEVTALAPAGTTLSATSGLKAVGFPGTTDDLVLATIDVDTNPDTTYPPLEPTLAPGISVDLSKCADADGCTLVATSEGGPAATLSNVQLASTAKGATLFLVKNIADCRWILADLPSSQWPTACTQTGVVYPSGEPPQKQYLNIALLMPKEVTDQFPDGFFDDTPMYLSPNLRAQRSDGRYYFDAFFFVPQSGVIFKDVANLEVDVAGLTNDQLGCVVYPTSSWPVSLASLLRWDATATISEYVRVIGGPSTQSYTDMFINTGCGSTRSTTPRTSAIPVNLELTPNVYPHSPSYDPPEDYFVHLTVGLFYDLRTARNETACQSGGPLAGVSVTPPGGTPTLLCGQLASLWDNAKQKLEKCITDGNYPKANEAVANCNAFRSQLQNYANWLDYAPGCVAGQACSDPQNRLGEQKARVETIFHVFNDRMLPSLPTNGWRYPAYEGLPLPQ